MSREASPPALTSGSVSVGIVFALGSLFFEALALDVSKTYFVGGSLRIYKSK